MILVIKESPNTQHNTTKFSQLTVTLSLQSKQIYLQFLNQMTTQSLYAIALPAAAILLAVFAIWLRMKVNSIQKEQDALRRERIARDRALERVRRFEEMENRRFEKSYHLNLEERSKRKKRVLAQLCICVSIVELISNLILCLGSFFQHVGVLLSTIGI